MIWEQVLPYPFYSLSCYFPLVISRFVWEDIQVNKRHSFYKLLIALPALLLSLLFLAPIAWSLISSIKHTADILKYPPILFPKNITLEQYIKLFRAGDGVFLLFIRNTIIMTTFTISLVLIISVLASYAFVSLPFKGSNFIFILILSIFMVPFQALLIPLYSILNKLRLLDTKVGMVLVYSTFFMPFCIFMFRNYFSGIPVSIRESARLDGASELTILLKFYLPLSLPAVATIVVYLFLETWNDFVLSLIFSSSNNVKNIQVGIMNFGRQRFQSDWGIINSGSIFSLLPTIIIFLMLQKYYIQGMTAGASKE
ncbi:MAG: carbohydrate ABC transporter permease [Spirochaetes bacterium]|nr:carbohydrate ABC transporter permease [Spirochaetota bacterium]